MADNVIYNQNKLRRIVSFEGLPKVGNCSPADIDVPPVLFCIEVGKMKRYLIGDFKEWGKWFREPVDGQKILLEKHVAAFTSIGYNAVAFLAWHQHNETIIDASKSVVVYHYWNGEWNEPIIKEPLITRYCRFFGIKETT